MELKLKNNNSLVINQALPQGVGSACTKLFVKECQYVSGIILLRSCPNLQRVYVSIGPSVTGPMSELLGYAAIGDGYDASENEVDKPNIIGTFTVNDYYSQPQIDSLGNAFYNNGLTIVTDPNKNITNILTNAGVQVLDEDEANFNPAVAIKLQAGGFGTLLDFRYTEHGGKWFVLKSDLANITNTSQNNTKISFNGASSLTDSNGIVTDDITASYDFESFDEFEYFTRLGTVKATWFKNCANLKSIIIPEGITAIETGSFENTSLEKITLKNASPISIANDTFKNISTLHEVYIGNLNVYLRNVYNNVNAAPTYNGAHLYNLDGTEITTIDFPSGTTIINVGALYNAQYITEINIPNTVTEIRNDAFGYTNITRLIIPDSITIPFSNLCSSCFRHTNSLSYVEFPGFEGNFSSPTKSFDSTTGIIIIRGNVIYTGTTDNGNRAFGKFPNIAIRGNFQRYDDLVSPGTTNDKILTIRINGNYSNLGGGNNSLCYGQQFRFCEINGTYTAKLSYAATTGLTNGLIIHLGYNGVAGTYANLGNLTRLTKLYVGDGSSRANDQAVLNQYIVDSNFNTLYTSNKLAIWYDYHGEFRTYKVTDTLTNCVNINPALYPYITRGDSYQTTIEAEDGYTLGTVTVQMRDTDSTSPTYDTMVDITSSVYNNGEINIPQVTGDVVIAATAN